MLCVDKSEEVDVKEAREEKGRMDGKEMAIIIQM